MLPSDFLIAFRPGIHPRAHRFALIAAMMAQTSLAWTACETVETAAPSASASVSGKDGLNGPGPLVTKPSAGTPGIAAPRPMDVLDRPCANPRSVQRKTESVM